eukprot:229734-Prorocentrum_minimum.AAC.2
MPRPDQSRRRKRRFACDASRAKGERSGRKWGSGLGGEKRGRGAMGVERILAVIGTGGPVK